MSDKFIDLDKIINDRNPRLKKWLPNFLLNYLKKILHQKEINEIINATENLDGFEFCTYVLQQFNIKIDVHGLENIPRSGGQIFAANHPLGGMDALAIVQEMQPIRTDFKFVVNDVLLNLKPLQNLFIGVNKLGSNSKESITAFNQEFEKEQGIFVFPAGLVSRKKKNKVKDLVWKKTFISRSRKFKKDVIPVFLDGELSDFFYNLANFRERIGLKTNIEMLYLVNELFKQKNKTYPLYFGKSIPFHTFDKSKTDLEWAAYVKNKVYTLKNE
ncbi:1-acyl-sn-glycerol-3-phosphate acyltransferase [Putridiphycobacter roseus]|nr:1-acyl-sn-glycerol-3-phosphate acyltransferase [Putridiphycobacter roseus]